MNRLSHAALPVVVVAILAVVSPCPAQDPAAVGNQPGLKVVDYAENGVVPILPRIASFTELFSEGDVAFYRADDAASLAAAIDARLAAPFDNARLARLAEQHGIERRVRTLETLFDSLPCA